MTSHRQVVILCNNLSYNKINPPVSTMRLAVSLLPHFIITTKVKVFYLTPGEPSFVSIMLSKKEKISPSVFLSHHTEISRPSALVHVLIRRLFYSSSRTFCMHHYCRSSSMVPTWPPVLSKVSSSLARGFFCSQERKCCTE